MSDQMQMFPIYQSFDRAGAVLRTSFKPFDGGCLIGHVEFDGANHNIKTDVETVEVIRVCYAGDEAAKIPAFDQCLFPHEILSVSKDGYEQSELFKEPKPPFRFIPIDAVDADNKAKKTKGKASSVSTDTA